MFLALIHHASPSVSAAPQVGKTKIVAFSNYKFRAVAVEWYTLMSNLGYTSHVIVATDTQMATFLQDKKIRHEDSFHNDLPPDYENKTQRRKERAVLQLLMAVRWKYLLEQLQQGIHVLITDIDNIFTRHVPMTTFEDEDSVDVMHAYATKYPQKIFANMGFVVCSGMSWWRASPPAIQFATIMKDECGSMCDDQRELNRIIDENLDMEWDWDPKGSTAIRLTNETAEYDPRFVGLLTQELYGQSKTTGHRTKLWNRDFAYRGLVNPKTCPTENWVSMPVLESKTRNSAWLTKLKSFQEWETNCGQQIRKDVSG